MSTRHAWLAERPFTLVLSAGFFGFFAHTGVLAALTAAGLRPRRVVGVSAGALAGGLFAAGMDPAALTEELCRLRRPDFWDPAIPLGGLLRGEKFRDKLRDLLGSQGVRSFEECPIPFAAVVHDVLRRRPEAVERGPLVPAIRASCTVPLMFRPLWIDRTLLVDGGVSDRHGLCALSPGERVLMHALPSTSGGSRLLPPQPVPTSAAEREVLAIPGLPRVSPFRLDHGKDALGRAYAHVRAWLREPRDAATSG
ncbi:MAG: patatin-like phospholipase family protein [Nannocystaceae bacterium]